MSKGYVSMNDDNGRHPFPSIYEVTLTFRWQDGRKEEYTVNVEAHNRDEAWIKADEKISAMRSGQQDTIHEAMMKHRKIPQYMPEDVDKES